MTRPDWMVPGADVVEFTPRRHGQGGGAIVETTIDRVLKRDVVLANGHRYNADNPTKRNDSWNPPTRLLAADDPEVDRARATNNHARLLRLGVKAAEDVAQIMRELAGERAKRDETPHVTIAHKLSTLETVAAALAEHDRKAGR